MAGEWSVDGDARGLCGCHECSGFGTPEEQCERAIIAKGLRRGLLRAAETVDAYDQADCECGNVDTTALARKIRDLLK